VDAAERRQDQTYVRLAIFVQAACLLAVIATTLPEWIDGRLHPLVCTRGVCVDLRGLAFDIAVTVLGPVIVLLVVVAWRWKGASRWPLALIAGVDIAAILVTIGTFMNFFNRRVESLPPDQIIPVLMLLPAMATLILSVNLVKPVPWKAWLAAGAAFCVLLSAFMELLSARQQ
jgi:hypothetical protein